MCVGIHEITLRNIFTDVYNLGNCSVPMQSKNILVPLYSGQNRHEGVPTTRFIESAERLQKSVMNNIKLYEYGQAKFPPYSYNFIHMLVEGSFYHYQLISKRRFKSSADVVPRTRTRRNSKSLLLLWVAPGWVVTPPQKLLFQKTDMVRSSYSPAG